MLLIVGQTAGPIRTKLGTRTRLDPGSVSVKSGSRSRSTITIGVKMETP